MACLFRSAAQVLRLLPLEFVCAIRSPFLVVWPFLHALSCYVRKLHAYFVFVLVEALGRKPNSWAAGEKLGPIYMTFQHFDTRTSGESQVFGQLHMPPRADKGTSRRPPQTLASLRSPRYWVSLVKY